MPDRRILGFAHDGARFFRVLDARDLYAHDALIEHERNVMNERFVDAHDRRDVRGREPPGEIGDRFQIERAVLHVDHAVIEAGGFDDVRNAARRELLQPGSERGASLAHGPAYAVLFHVSPPYSATAAPVPYPTTA